MSRLNVGTVSIRAVLDGSSIPADAARLGADVRRGVAAAVAEANSVFARGGFGRAAPPPAQSLFEQAAARQRALAAQAASDRARQLEVERRFAAANRVGVESRARDQAERIERDAEGRTFPARLAKAVGRLYDGIVARVDAGREAAARARGRVADLADRARQALDRATAPVREAVREYADRAARNVRAFWNNLPDGLRGRVGGAGSFLGRLFGGGGGGGIVGRLGGAAGAAGRFLGPAAAVAGAAISTLLKPFEFLGRALEFAVGAAVDRIALGLTSALIAAGKAAVRLAADFEQAKIAFEVMTGSAQRGTRTLEAIQQLAVETPFKSADLIRESKLLLGYGVQLEDLIPTLKRLGDAAAGTGADLNRLALAYGQVIAKGRFQATELRQFSEAGIGVSDFARTARLSPAQFLARMEQGLISARVVEQTFARLSSSGGRFFGLMDKLARTVKGRFDALVETAELFAQKLGGAVFQRLGVAATLNQLVEAVRGVDLNAASAWVGRMADGLRPVGAALGVVAEMTADWFHALYAALPTWREFADGFAAAAEETLPLVGVAVEKLTVGFARLAGAITYAANELTKFGAKRFNELSEAVEAKTFGLLRLGRLPEGGIAGAEGFRDFLREFAEQVGGRNFAEIGLGFRGRLRAANRKPEPNLGGLLGVGRALLDPAAALAGKSKEFESVLERVSTRFENLADAVLPGFKQRLEDVLQGAQVPADRPFAAFQKNVGALNLARVAGAFGLPGGISEAVLGRALGLQFEKLVEKANLRPAEPPPLLRSRSQEAESALTRAMVQAQAGGAKTPEQILAVLQAMQRQDQEAAARDEERNRVLRDLNNKGQLNGVRGPRN